LDVAFATEKLAKAMNSDTKLCKTYGPDIAKQIRRRLDDFQDAETLADLRTLPGRCEELTGNRAGQLSVRVSANDRLIFRPNHDPLPTKHDGGLDWTEVTAVEVIQVIDYH